MCLCVWCACTYVPFQDAEGAREGGREGTCRGKKKPAAGPVQEAVTNHREWDRLSGMGIVGAEAEGMQGNG